MDALLYTIEGGVVAILITALVIGTILAIKTLRE